MSTNFIDVLLAAAPPLAVLVLMVGFRWGGSRAGTVGWITALVIALVNFGAWGSGGDVLVTAHIRALVLTADVVLIVWAALLLYMVMDHSGALPVIAGWFTGLTRNDVLRVLLLGWVFTSFLQGVGGFGVPVAIVAPLLVGLGLSPLAAIVVPSIGHAWAVTFGSLGSSFIALIGVTGMEADLLTEDTALMLGVAAFACGTLAAHAYAGWRGVRLGLPAVLVIGAAMSTAQFIAATNGLWNVGAAIGGLAGLTVGLWVTRWPMYRAETVSDADTADSPIEESPSSEATEKQPSFVLAISGYAVLVVLAVLIKGVEPIKSVFAEIRLSIHLPEVVTSLDWVTPATDNLGFSIFGHTGAILLYSSLIAYVLLNRNGYFEDGAPKAIYQGVRKRGVRPAIGILSMMAMAMVMANAGMTRTLAEWLSQAVPADLYAVVGTAIGALGAFMTGSNTNSNAVFGTLQMDTAGLLGISVTVVLATQTSAAAIASLLAPAKIMVGASTVGMSGDEGRVLRALVLYGGLLLLLIAGLSFILLQA